MDYLGNLFQRQCFTEQGDATTFESDGLYSHYLFYFIMLSKTIQEERTTSKNYNIYSTLWQCPETIEGNPWLEAAKSISSRHSSSIAPWIVIHSEMRIEGLETLDYLDNHSERQPFTEQGDAITFESEVYLPAYDILEVLPNEIDAAFKVYTRRKCN
ncbi:Glucose-6-phosphate 1-epimerase [Forsythia ovata]|uniref:Glucose-6-phosphate 1-epimerase n=1 Tax=Forsythia ovata TaxID=205694 RepID=A0ABD1PYI1_9LAMI